MLPPVVLRIATRTPWAALVIGCAEAAPTGEPTPTLASVVVTPALDTVAPGGNRNFVATAQYSDGSSGTTPVTWSATGGTVSSSGVFTAGAMAGSFRVIAAATGALRADTSTIVIRDTTTPPASGTVLLTEAFENANIAARGWYDNTNPIISSSEHRSGAGSLQMAWQVGGTTPANGGSLRHLFTPTESVYLRYWVKYSANFVGSGVGYHPHEFEFLTTADGQWIGPSRSHLGTLMEMNWQNGGYPRVATTDALNIDVTRVNVDLSNISEARSVSGCNGNTDGYPTDCYTFGGNWYNGKQWTATQPAFTNTAGPKYKNAWHKVEVFLQLNTIAGGRGQTNGIVQVWVDDVAYLNLNNVLFRTAAHATMRFNQFLIAPYIGDGSPAAQTMWIDDVVIATARVP